MRMDDIIEEILTTFGSNNPQVGCTFISEDGTFVNIYPKIDCHEDLCYWVEDNLNIDLPYEDEEYFVREYNWIRLRSDPSMLIIELPQNYPTNKQWYSLQDWLEFCEDNSRHYPIVQSRVIYIGVVDGDSHEYDFGKEIFTEDIMKLLKRSYATGKFYASTSITASEENEEDTFDYLINFYINSELKLSAIWYEIHSRYGSRELADSVTEKIEDIRSRLL